MAYLSLTLERSKEKEREGLTLKISWSTGSPNLPVQHGHTGLFLNDASQTHKTGISRREGAHAFIFEKLPANQIQPSQTFRRNTDVIQSSAMILQRRDQRSEMGSGMPESGRAGTVLEIVQSHPVPSAGPRCQQSGLSWWKV